MTLTISVPDRYPLVLLTAVGSTWLTMWQGFLVAKHRNRAKILYPQAYAEKAEAEKSLDAMKFNCAQRAHQNTLENLPQTILCIAVGGLKYPTLTAALGATWLVGRVIYTLGYSTGDPKKRVRGAIGNLAAIGVWGTATWSLVELVYNL